MPATQLLREDNTKPDGSRYQMVAWAVPESEAFPEGVKYSFQYMDAGGNTLLRFDNAPYHTDVGRHHKHTTTGGIKRLAYTSLRDLAEQFLTEVNEIHDQRTN
jgi:hypothetical protein